MLPESGVEIYGWDGNGQKGRMEMEGGRRNIISRGRPTLRVPTRDGRLIARYHTYIFVLRADRATSRVE